MHPTRKFAWAALFCAAAAATSSISFAQSSSPAVFVTNNVGDSVSSFTVNPNGSLNFVGMIPSGDGPQTVSLSPNGRWLCVANGTASTTTEEMRVFEVNPDATLTPRVTTTVPDSPLDVQWLSNSVVAVTHTALSGTNEVRTFNFNPGANTVTQVDAKPTGSFNTRLATTRNGTLLYANNTSGANSIFGFSVAPTGVLTQVDNEPTTGFAVNIAASQDGRHLYGAGGISGDGHRILGFTIDATGGLTPTAAVSYTSSGVSPKVVALTGDDRILLAGHGTDATIHTFLRNSATGDLTETPFFFDVGDQGNLGDLQTLGNLMFVTHSFSDGTGPTGLYSFTVNPDGSLTQNGPLVSTNGTRPEYIAAWPGVPEPTGALLAVTCCTALGVGRRRN
jgi:6-phosphogluconolactonase (cycloisomerase 2 family)